MSALLTCALRSESKRASGESDKMLRSALSSSSLMLLGCSPMKYERHSDTSSTMQSTEANVEQMRKHILTIVALRKTRDTVAELTQQREARRGDMETCHPDVEIVSSELSDTCRGSKRAKPARKVTQARAVLHRLW